MFDNIHGLFNAIYYSKINYLNKYKKRFKDVKYIISPDNSLIGDVPEATNIYNIYKSRVVSLYLTLECNKLVIPNITYATKKSFEYMLDGIQDCNVVSFSTKGSLKNHIQKELLKDSIKYTVDNLLKLRQIVVYDVSNDNDKILELFKYAINKDIQILIPNNILKSRNVILKK